MGKSKPPYPKAFRAEAVKLARSGERSGAQIVRDLGISYEASRSGIKQADLDEGKRSDGITSAERDELNRLRCENRVLR